MNISLIILLAHLALSFALFSLIWVIQLVHYPSFHFIDSAKFSDFSLFHQSGISILVIPLMITELALCCWSVYAYNFDWRWMVPLLLVCGIWISTFLFSAPAHAKLSQGYNAEEIRILVNTNWIRTVLWTVKVIWISILVFRSIASGTWN